MAASFTSIGNHMVSDSAAAIKAGADDLSTIGADESVMGDGNHGQLPGRGRRRRGDDDDETDTYDDDDLESLISQSMNGTNGQVLQKPEEEVELPAHACAYVYRQLLETY